MSMTGPQEVATVLETVKTWPTELRISLARRILETVETTAVPTTDASAAEINLRGKPVEELIGLGAGSGEPPSDKQVAEWIDEHRLEKHGR